MVKHAGELISKYQFNRKGQTAYCNVFGRPCKDVIVELGEEVHYRVSEVDTGSLDGRWVSGVWLGIRWKSKEHHIGTAARVIKSHAVERKPRRSMEQGSRGSNSRHSMAPTAGTN